MWWFSKSCNPLQLSAYVALQCGRFRSVRVSAGSALAGQLQVARNAGAIGGLQGSFRTRKQVNEACDARARHSASGTVAAGHMPFTPAVLQ